MIDLKGKVIIVTGSVGNLGLATGRRLQEAGATTVLVDRALDRLQKAYPDLKDADHHLFLGGVNLGDPASVDAMAEQVRTRFNRIDALVNTVGAYRGGKPVHEDDLANWDFLFDVNLRTALNTCRAVIPHMLRQKSGRIVNVVTRNSFAGAPGYAAYSASKTALLRMTESLAGEVKQNGINVNCVVPGTIDTPDNRQARPDADRSTWVEPEAIADVIVFLVSDAARSVTGAAVPVYGKG